MIKKKENKGIEIDLTGPEGNAFFLLGTAQSLAKRIGMNKTETDELLNRMRSSDYENLVNVFDETFGSIVTLYR